MLYKRVMLKISGEVLGGKDGVGADSKALMALCQDIKKLSKKKLQLAIVVGGGNFWRFRDNAKLKIPRSSSDTIGMMATIMNARLLQEALRSIGVKAEALAAHGNFYFAEPYTSGRGRKLLSDGHVVVCGGGSGNPFFTTDSAAALRALELECDVLLKATKVDGVFDKDPFKYKNAKFYKDLSFKQAMKLGIGVMDMTAVTLCMENKLPIRVFNLQTKGNLLKACAGRRIGSLIS